MSKNIKKLAKKMEQKLWQSYKYLKKNKSNLQCSESLDAYIDTFLKPLIHFFESMLTSILENKIAESN